MRTKQEIKRAVAILRQKGDALSLAQAAVIEYQRTESWVFAHYVQNVSADEKDETTFFAARDAARYVAGGIALEELIPDATDYPEVPQNCISLNEIMVPVELIERLIDRIESLEKKIDTLTEKESKDAAYTRIADHSKDDFMTQDEACKYVGCTKDTLISWRKKTFVKGYRKGAHVYYSQSELDASPTVQNFMNIRKKK